MAQDRRPGPRSQSLEVREDLGYVHVSKDWTHLYESLSAQVLIETLHLTVLVLVAIVQHASSIKCVHRCISWKVE